MPFADSLCPGAGNIPQEPWQLRIWCDQPLGGIWFSWDSDAGNIPVERELRVTSFVVVVLFFNSTALQESMHVKAAFVSSVCVLEWNTCELWLCYGLVGHCGFFLSVAVFSFTQPMKLWSTMDIMYIYVCGTGPDREPEFILDGRPPFWFETPHSQVSLGLDHSEYFVVVVNLLKT